MKLLSRMEETCVTCPPPPNQSALFFNYVYSKRNLFSDCVPGFYGFGTFVGAVAIC